MKKGKNSFSNLLNLFMSHRSFYHISKFFLEDKKSEGLSFISSDMVELENSTSFIKRILQFYFILGPWIICFIYKSRFLPTHKFFVSR